MAAIHPNIPTAPYNLDLMKNITNPNDVFLAINTNLGGLFGLGILSVLFLIVYTVGLWKESDLAFAGAAWVTWLVAVYFGRIGLIAGQYVGAFSALALLAIILLWKQKGKGGY